MTHTTAPRHRTARRRLVAALVTGLVAALALAGLVAAPAHALTDRWATYDALAGGGGAYTTTLRQRSPGFPVAAVASDSRAAAQVASGASTFLGAATPPGAKYGSSAGSPYLVLRPRADNATAPSTTTYTFASPTPDTGWAFVLGDVDADQVRVTATDAAGDPVPAARVSSWFEGAFNYAGAADVPTWSPATSTLTGNTGALDTDGASGWFEPDLRLSSLTMTFTRRAGFPVYQTWFVSRARPVGGTVADTSAVGACAPTQTTLRLLSPAGDVLGTTSPAADGSYAFGEVATQDGYTVQLDAPASCAVLGAAQRTVSTRGSDGAPASRADFAVRAVVPQPVSGTVRDDAGAPVAGVTVTLTAPGGGPVTTTTTGADGTYLLDDNAAGVGYTVAVSVPPGYLPGPAGTTRTLDVAAVPVTGQDLVVVALPSVTGTVSLGGTGVGGVQVVLTPVGGGTPLTAVTDGSGTYDLDRVPPGDHLLAAVAPAGSSAPPPRPVTVPAGGLVGQDLALSRPGALGGTVTRDGAPVGGVTVTVDGPGGPRTLVTDADGQFFLDQLAPGTWTITATVPPGTTLTGPATRTVTITTGGEVRGGQDFALASAAVVPSPSATPAPSPSPAPASSPTASPSPQGGNAVDDSSGSGAGTGTAPTVAVLPDTGGPQPWVVPLGLLLMACGVAVLGRRRRT